MQIKTTQAPFFAIFRMSKKKKKKKGKRKAIVPYLGPASSSNHLQDVCLAVLFKGTSSVVHGGLYNDQVSRQVHSHS